MPSAKIASGRWDLYHGHTAVDVQGLAGDVGALFAGKVDAGGGDVAALAQPPGRDAGEDGFLLRLVERVGHGAGDEAGRHAVDRDVAAGDFLGQRLLRLRNCFEAVKSGDDGTFREFVGFDFVPRDQIWGKTLLVSIVP